MASKEQLSDPSSPEPSKESAGPSSISDTQATSDTPTTSEALTSPVSDFEKIDIISSKSTSISKQVTSPTPSSPTAPIEEPVQTSCCDSIDKIECNANPLNVIIFLFAMAGFLLRSVLYKIPDLYYEVLVFALSLMAGAVLTCLVKRGHYAKTWMPSSPKPRVPRPNSAQDINPMEPMVPRKRPTEEVARQQTLEAIIHHEADTESIREASGSSPKSVSSGSDKPVPPTSEGTRSDRKKKDVKPEDVKTDTPSSSPVTRAYKYLFKRN